MRPVAASLAPRAAEVLLRQYSVLVVSGASSPGGADNSNNNKNGKIKCNKKGPSQAGQATPARPRHAAAPLRGGGGGGSGSVRCWERGAVRTPPERPERPEPRASEVPGLSRAEPVPSLPSCVLRRAELGEGGPSRASGTEPVRSGAGPRRVGGEGGQGPQRRLLDSNLGSARRGGGGARR